MVFRGGTRSPPKRTGSLVVVGTGITFLAHLTVEARAAIIGADKVLYLAAEPATDALIRRLNLSADSLDRFYSAGRARIESYREMADEIHAWVNKGLAVCAVFEGHPGVFVDPAHRAIERVREAGLEARMLPGISADACLYADLGVDPGRTGSQSFEATDFLVHRRRFDPASALILWQVGAIGRRRTERSPNRRALEALAEKLGATYGSDWGVVLYQAALFPLSDPVIRRTTLSRLTRSRIGPLVTLYVPPKVRRRSIERSRGIGIGPEAPSRAAARPAR